MQLRLIQLTNEKLGRRIARVDEPRLTLLAGYKNIYDLAQAAISSRKRIADLVQAETSIDYGDVYSGQSDWSLLPAFDHPHEPARCLVAGTGLTHKGSAENRQAMHDTAMRNAETLTDSMKMYRIGLEGGRPASGAIGAEPEWFYKGNGNVLRAPGAALDVPAFGDDGGDEAEIAGVYLISPEGSPHRVGMVQGNEFADHVLEAKNYLYLASSKLRACSIGPELVVDADFAEVKGRSWIERKGAKIWEAEQRSGEAWMSHSLVNLEHHHFKHQWHRTPGDVHIHFMGADNFSFKQRLRLEDGDEMVVSYENFGRALRNPIQIDRSRPQLVTVKSL